MADKINNKIRVRLLEIGVSQAVLAVMEASPYALSRINSSANSIGVDGLGQSELARFIRNQDGGTFANEAPPGSADAGLKTVRSLS